MSRNLFVCAFCFSFLCSGFLPAIIAFLRRVPLIGSLLNLPGISAVRVCSETLCVVPCFVWRAIGAVKSNVCVVCVCGGVCVCACVCVCVRE